MDYFFGHSRDQAKEVVPTLGKLILSRTFVRDSCVPVTRKEKKRKKRVAFAAVDRCVEVRVMASVPTLS